MRGGGENVILLEVSESHRHILRMGGYRCVDKMKFAATSKASKCHSPGRTGYTQISKHHSYGKKTVLWLL